MPSEIARHQPMNRSVCVWSVCVLSDAFYNIPFWCRRSASTVCYARTKRAECSIDDTITTDANSKIAQKWLCVVRRSQKFKIFLANGKTLGTACNVPAARCRAARDESVHARAHVDDEFQNFAKHFSNMEPKPNGQNRCDLDVVGRTSFRLETAWKSLESITRRHLNIYMVINWCVHDFFGHFASTRRQQQLFKMDNWSIDDGATEPLSITHPKWIESAFFSRFPLHQAVQHSIDYPIRWAIGWDTVADCLPVTWLAKRRWIWMGKKILQFPGIHGWLRRNERTKKKNVQNWVICRFVDV